MASPSNSTIFLLLLSFLLLPFATTAASCNSTQLDLLSSAFRYVSGFDPRLVPNCSELRLPSRGLSGTVSWQHLRNLTGLAAVDLSGNSLRGHIPSSFWDLPSLLHLNLSSNALGGPVRLRNSTSALLDLDLSGNRFAAASVSLLGFAGLRLLDLSRNSLAAVPGGLTTLTNLTHLDLSSNGMNGSFPSDFPTLATLRFLDLSFNNFTGEAPAGLYAKFGAAAFAHSGILPPHGAEVRSSTGTREAKRKKARRWSSARLALAAGVPALVSALVGLCVVLVVLRRRTTRRKEQRPEEEEEEAEPTWVAEARAQAATARVVMYEKPLMELTFADLHAATSGFSRAARLGDGEVYRALLPGDMHVAVKRVAARDAAGLAALRHPNLLPLLGQHCLGGDGGTLLVYPYMEHGDLRRWLREPPLAGCEAEAWAPQEDWATRFRIALGVARGVAYLHHAARVHGELDARSVLLDEDLEARVHYTGYGGDGATAAVDVHAYGVVLLELLSGSGGTVDAVRRIRGLVREGRGSTALDDRVAFGADVEAEMAEALRVAYLCTAEDAEKRPGMRQVVAMLKDVRAVP